ncbi:MAG TPA: hypothetical protein VHX38_03710 [Pseudonocardiaceae bacterium]|jgi:hypothetical protein|nr:hypothetical protein [Pseudonocardiaceae bacterium]
MTAVVGVTPGNAAGPVGEMVRVTTQQPAAPTGAPVSRPRKRGWLWIAIAAPVVAALVAGVFVLGQRSATSSTTLPAPAPSTAAAAAATAGGPTFDMKGAFDLFVDSGTLPAGTQCVGTGSYADVAVGSTVYVYDGQGTLLATGHLGVGTFVSNPVGNACVFPLDVPNVPDGRDSYSVEIDQHGEQSVSSTTAHSWVFLSVSNF